MRISVLLCVLIIFPLLLSAQIKKKIGFIPYTDPDNAEEEYRELAYRNIYDAALRVFVNTQRFDVLDRGSFNIIKIEKEFQKGDDLANVEIVEQGKISAAQLLVVAKLTTFIISDSDDGNGYSVYITAEIKQIDVKSGKATSAFQLKAEAIDKQGNMIGLSNKRIKTEEEAISKAVISMEKDLEAWVKREFPMILKVRDIDKKNRQLIVDGGRIDGLSKRIKMKAVRITIYPDGKKQVRNICKLKFLKEGVGEDITDFKVSSKKEWATFLENWKNDPDKIYVTEDL